MKLKLFSLLVLGLSLATSRYASASTGNVDKLVVKLLVQNAAQIKLVDTNGKALPSQQQLSSLIADTLTTGFEDAAEKGTKLIALNQASAECKARGKDELNCTVTIVTTNFEVANDGYQLTKLDDASGGWDLAVKLVKKNGQWTLKSNLIPAFYAE